MEEVELNPVTTMDAEKFYEPVYTGTTVSDVKEVTDPVELNQSYVYEKTFYLKAGALKTKSGRRVNAREKYYDIMLLGPEQEDEYTGCVIEQAPGASTEGGATAANSIRIAFIVEGEEVSIYEPNSAQHNGGDKATNGVNYGTYETMKQPSPGADFEEGEGGNSKTMFTIKEEEDVLVTMRIWIEGTDDDCTNSIQMDEIIGNIQFISKDAEDAGR